MRSPARDLCSESTSPSRRVGRRLHLLPLSLLACVFALSAACAPGDERSDHAVVRIGWLGYPDSFNPGVGVLSEAYILYGLIYDSMFQLELDHSYTPHLTEDWTVSPDGTEWTFHLRPDLAFHDGHPLTAEDVVFSYELYRNHAEFPFLHGYTALIEDVEATGPLTVTLRLRLAIPNLPSQLTYLYILPRHLWQEHESDPVLFRNEAMVGSGPFTLLEHRTNEFLRLGAHRDHHHTPPSVDEVIFVSYGTVDALVQALRSGEVDLIRELPLTAVEALRRDSGIEVAAGEPLTPKVIDLKLNQADPTRCPDAVGVCSGHPALRDVRVRRALSHATPKQELVDVIELGFAHPGRTLVARGFGAYHDASLPDYAYDLARATELLDEAGYTDPDGDGVRNDPATGEPLRLRFFYPSDAASAPRSAELIGRSWSQVGIALDRRAVDPGALSAARSPALDYDVILWSWDSDPDPNFLLSVMTSGEIETGGNDTGWSNAEYDDLFYRQATASSEEERQALMHRMQRLAMDDAVYIVLYDAQNVQAHRTDRFLGWRTDERGLMLEDRSTLVQLRPVASAPSNQVHSP